MHFHSEALIKDLIIKAQTFRIQAVKMVFEAGSGHLGGSLSVAEILTSLYFHHLHIDPTKPTWPERDRLLYSKGHSSPMFYTVLAYRGFFPIEELATFRKLGSRLQGHPERSLPGVEICAGPLGHGIAIGVGTALSLRMGIAKPSAFTAPSARASLSRVYVVLGDGELNAGLIWEGAMVASKYHLGNLTAIIDYNGIQQTGATADVMPMEPILAKWQSFGWHVQEVDGHNIGEILNALDRADEVHAQPSMIIARTTKGKGVSYMEYDHRWHGQPLNEANYKLALAELEKGLRQCQS
jgi:transketolase